MTDKTPATLDQLWDSIPTGSAPIDHLLTAGRTASRRRRNTRLAGFAAATAVLIGGVALQQARTPTSDQSGDPIAAEEHTATDQPAPENTLIEHPCPDSQSVVALDVPGPGRPTPQEAVAPYIVGSALLISEDSRSATVIEVGGYGSATRVFEVARRKDGWWPDSYVVCRSKSQNTPLPGEAPVSDVPCPPAPASTHDIDRSTVPAPDDAKGLTANDAGTVATWFEPESGPLPYLVVYDLTSGVELAREDLGVGEDLRSSSLRVDETALYYQSSADANVWLRYRWGVDDYPSVYVLCTG